MIFVHNAISYYIISWVNKLIKSICFSFIYYQVTNLIDPDSSIFVLTLYNLQKSKVTQIFE